MENGVVDENLSTYKANRNLCQYGKFNSFRQNLVKGFDYCEESSEEKKCTREYYLSLLSKGPLIVAMDAEFEGFSRYKPGNDFAPAVPEYCGRVNHAVVAVGIVTENGEDFLLARNSWGVNWGKEGYFKINTKNSCGILDNAWLPYVQKDIPLSETKCPLFASECDLKGKNISSCFGVNDFESKIGGDLKSYKNENPNNIYMNFYEEKNCQGNSHWNYDNDLKCLADNYSYSGLKIKSASIDSMSIPWGCIQHFTDSCYDGDRTLICESIEDISKTDFVFTKGSLFAPSYSIKNIIFFDDVKFTGNGFGMKGKNFANLSDPKLVEIMSRAKSVLINPHDPNKPINPDW
jgi:hypothetical protein